MKGCICLDIDGTTTADPFCIPEPVIECFTSLHNKGWQFLFSTGRPFTFASKLFERFPFPFFLSVQNGADILQMPEKKLLFKEHLSSSFLTHLDELYKEMNEDFLIYAGFEKGDFCYYRPERFSSQALEYLKRVQAIVHEPWEALKEFEFAPDDSFPLIKGFGSKEQMHKLHEKLQPFEEVHSSYIPDPLSPCGDYLALITSKHATKGEVIKKMRGFFPSGTKVIAAGDERNDALMLKEADFAIVMETAPSDVLSLADLVARSAQNLGIIEALWTATGEEK